LGFLQNETGRLAFEPKNIIDVDFDNPSNGKITPSLILLKNPPGHLHLHMEIPQKTAHIPPPVPEHLRHNRHKPPITFLRLKMEINNFPINRPTQIHLNILKNIKP
jgi:hypothetical protein